MKPVIGFCGMGHLGVNSKAAAMIKGFEIISYEFGKTGDFAGDLRKCDVVYICPDRPDHHAPPETFVDIALRYMDPCAVLVVLCQVNPGYTRSIRWPFVYYQVETLKVNDEAMDRALNPERIIIGRRDGSMPIVKKLYDYLLAFNCPIITMSYESAELAKIAINIYLAAQICTTNTLVSISKEIGANWDDVRQACRTDKRIGYDAYLQPGNGCGKHIERDLKVVNEYGGTEITQVFLKYSEISGDNTKQSIV